MSTICDEHVCLCVRLSGRISSELRVQSSPHFVNMLPMVVARSLSDRVLISCILPALWMKSFLHNGPYVDMSLLAITTATPLQRREQTNAPAAWHWLHPVLDGGGRQT